MNFCLPNILLLSIGTTTETNPWG